MFKNLLQLRRIAIALLALSVTAGKPSNAVALGTIVTNPSSLTFQTNPNGVVQFQEITVTVSGASAISQWTVNASANYSIRLSTQDGPAISIAFSGNKTIKLFVHLDNVTIAGPRNGEIEIVGVDIGSKKIPITGSVKAIPVTTPTSIFFSTVENKASDPEPIAVSILGLSATAKTTITAPPFYLLRDASGNLLQSVQVTGSGIFSVQVLFAETALTGVFENDLVVSGPDVVTRTVHLTTVCSENPTFFPKSFAFSTVPNQPSAPLPLDVTVQQAAATDQTDIFAPINFSLRTSLTGTPVKLLSFKGSGTFKLFVSFDGSPTVATTTANLSISTGSRASKKVPLTATVLANPTPVVNPASLSGFTAIQGGTTSLAQSFDLTINALPGQASSTVSVTAPAGYLVSFSGVAGSFVGAFILSGTGSIKSKIFVAIKNNSAIGTIKGDVTITGNQIIAKKVPVTGTVLPKPAPTLTVDKTALSGFSTTTNRASTAQSFNLKAKNLDAGVNPIVKATPGYEVSLSNNTGSIFAAQLTLTHIADSINVNVFVRLKSQTATGSINGTVQNSVAGITKNVTISGTIVLPPSVVINPISITGLNTIQGQASAAKTYTITASNLATGVTATATASANFELRIQNSGSFTTSLTLPQTAAGAISRIIEVRLKSLSSAGTFTGNVQNTVAGFVKTVSLSGAVAAPTLTTSTTSLSFSTVKSQASTPVSYKVNATNLIPGASATVTASANYELSRQSNGVFSASLSLPLTSVNGISTDVFVRLKAIANTGSIPGTITHSVAGLTKTITLTGNVTAPAASTNPATLSGFTAVVNQPSVTKSYTLSASALASGLAATVTAPAGYQVSVQGTNVFSDALTIAQTTAGSISKVILVRLKAQVAKTSVTGNISNTVAGLTRTVALSGAVVAATLTTAAKLNTALTDTSLTASVFPNPFNSYCNLSVAAKASTTILVQTINLQGVIVSTENITATGSLQQVRITPPGQQPGIYLLKVTTAGSQKILRLLRQ